MSTLSIVIASVAGTAVGSFNGAFANTRRPMNWVLPSSRVRVSVNPGHRFQ